MNLFGFFVRIHLWGFHSHLPPCSLSFKDSMRELGGRCVNESLEVRPKVSRLGRQLSSLLACSGEQERPRVKRQLSGPQSHLQCWYQMSLPHRLGEQSPPKKLIARPNLWAGVDIKGTSTWRVVHSLRDCDDRSLYFSSYGSIVQSPRVNVLGPAREGDTP